VLHADQRQEVEQARFAFVHLWMRAEGLSGRSRTAPSPSGTAPRRVAETPTGNHPAGIPAPCEAPHQTTPGPPMIPRTGPSLERGPDRGEMPSSTPGSPPSSPRAPSCGAAPPGTARWSSCWSTARATTTGRCPRAS
jgi:hypothetical protein